MINIKVVSSSSDGNCFILSNEDTKILLECGIEKTQLIKALKNEKLTITDFNACLISHIHNDHSKLAEYVGYYLKVYSTYEVKEKYKKVEVNVLKPKKILKIGSISILPLDIEHGQCDNNAFIFIDKDSKVFFATDFSLMTYNLKNYAFDKVYIECNFDDSIIQQQIDNMNDTLHMKYIRQISTHMSKTNCIKHLKAMNLSKCQEIVLLHRSKFLIDTSETAKQIEQIFKIKTHF